MATGGRLGGKAGVKAAKSPPAKKKSTIRKAPVRRSKSREAKLKGEKLMDCTLKTFHIVNGHRYGPGKVRVSHDLGYTLLDMDRRAELAERMLFQDRATLILDHRRTLPVAPANFRGLVDGLNSPIFAEISGRGM